MIKLLPLPSATDARYDAARVARWNATKHLVAVWMARGFAHRTSLGLAWNGIEDECDVLTLGVKGLKARQAVGIRGMKLMKQWAPELVE